MQELVCLPDSDLTRRCSRRLAGLFPPYQMIKILKEIASPRSPLGAAELELVRRIWKYKLISQPHIRSLPKRNRAASAFAQKGSATKAISGNVNIVIDVAQIIREVAVLWILVRITPALKRGVKISINNKPLPPDEAGAKK